MIIVVTKVSVTTSQKDLWHITLNMTCTESAVEVINQNFSRKYRTGQAIGYLTAEFDKAMQKVINDYNSSQTLFNHAQLDTAVAWLNSNLTS